MDIAEEPDKAPGSTEDLEKNATSTDVSVHDDVVEVAITGPGHTLWSKLSDAGVELRGAQPVPVELRTDTRYFNIFTVFSTSMTSLLPYVLLPKLNSGWEANQLLLVSPSARQ
jgi:hypothetical protein